MFKSFFKWGNVIRQKIKSSQNDIVNKSLQKSRAPIPAMTCEFILNLLS